MLSLRRRKGIALRLPVIINGSLPCVNRKGEIMSEIITKESDCIIAAFLKAANEATAGLTAAEQDKVLIALKEAFSLSRGEAC